MREEVETVKASEITIGNRILMPNSRKPQEVTQHFTTEVSGAETTLSIVAGDATWVVKPDQEIRRVKAA